MKKGFLIFSFLLVVRIVPAQNSTDSLFYERFDYAVKTRPDTLFHNVHWYHPSIASKKASIGNSLGNYSSLVPKPNLSQTLNFSNVNLFDYGIDSLRFYEVTKAFTNLKFFIGSQNEQFFKATYNQKITKQLQLGFDLVNASNEGYYENQVGASTLLNVRLKYVSKNDNYLVLPYYIRKKTGFGENDGLQNDTSFIFNYYGDQKYNPFNETIATNNRRKNEIGVKQILKVSEQLYFFQEVSSFWERLNYAETGIDTSYSIHETHHNSFSHKTGAGIGKGKIDAQLWLGGNYFHVDAYTKYFFQYQNQIGGNINLSLGKIDSKNSLSFTQWGNNIAYLFNSTNSYENQSLKANIGIISSSSFPMVQYFYLDGFSNNFKNVGYQGLDAYVKHSKFKLSAGAKAGVYSNFLYIDKTNGVSQLNNSFSYFQVFAKKHLQVKSWNLDVKALYQSSASTALPVPNTVGTAALYYRHAFFKKHMDLEIGVQTDYFSAYYAPQYYAVFRQFAVQRENLVGNYPYLSGWVQARIKKACFFVKGMQVNSGLMGYNYFLSPHYPAPGMQIRAGLNWNFYD